jgi:RHS repeat-associated protein
MLRQLRIQCPDATYHITGLGYATNTITVNTVPAYRKGEYFREQLSVANGSAPVWTNITVAEGSAQVSGNLFVPKSPEAFSYDADGNLTSDGRWNYSWDAENRLVRMAPNTSIGPQQTLAFLYDWRGRRVQKQVSVNGVLTNSTAFVYDGWNLVAELNTLNAPPTLYRSYLWGLDLSGSEQGAGGVGGLLEVNDPTNGVHFAAYDGNGNVAGLVAATGGIASAFYEYGPFGEMLRANGPMAKPNPLRFSTKVQDDETDLLYYGYRYYDGRTGRWVARDPTGETGGLGLYGFAYGDGVNAVDLLGLVIECNCPEACFKANGITPGMYKKSGNTYFAVAGASGPSSGAGLILWRMLLTSHKFTAKSLDVEQLKRHVAARQTIVANALKANFRFLVATNHAMNWQGFYDDPQAFFDKLNNGETEIACNALTLIIFETGNNFGKDNGSTWAMGHRKYDRVWIPGDWGLIENRAYVPKVWKRGLEGENVIHTGLSGQDEMFWGHYKAGVHPSQPEKQWFQDIRKWASQDGSQHGNPAWRNDIKYPVTGLQPP